MAFFVSDEVRLAFEEFGAGPPLLLIHGFASSRHVNWINTSWVTTLTEAGFRVVAIDNRGHGESQKFYDPEQYWAHTMADDAARLLDHLQIGRALVMGYSMGARIAAFLALRHPQRVEAAVLGGMGLNLVNGLADSDEIIAALGAEKLSEVTGATGRQFRIFADNSRADRQALIACMITSREPMAEADVRRIAAPVLVAVGEADEMAGPPEMLADLLPQGEAFVIPKRNHMLATADRAFKAAALAFLKRHCADLRQA